MATIYEWCIETVDEHDDIIDLDFSDKLSAFKPSEIDTTHRLALLCNVGTDDDGLLDRQYAYSLEGVLPYAFDGGTTVPKRFIGELARWLAV